MSNNNQIQNEPVTACIYDKSQSGVWLLFTKNEPEFVSDIDELAYKKILHYMATYSSMRDNLYKQFSAMRANTSFNKPSAFAV